MKRTLISAMVGATLLLVPSFALAHDGSDHSGDIAPPPASGTPAAPPGGATEPAAPDTGTLPPPKDEVPVDGGGKKGEVSPKVVEPPKVEPPKVTPPTPTPPKVEPPVTTEIPKASVSSTPPPVSMPKISGGGPGPRPVVAGGGGPPTRPAAAPAQPLPFTGIEDAFIPMLLALTALMGATFLYRHAGTRDAVLAFTGRLRLLETIDRTSTGYESPYGVELHKVKRDESKPRQNNTFTPRF